MRNIVSYTLLLVLLTFLIFGNSSCRKDLDFENLSQNLRFSQDTVFLDTVFSQSNSETYLLKIYNEQDQDVLIPQIYLNNRAESYFRVNVDGSSGYEFSDVALRAKDSLMVFVEIASQIAPANMIYEDELMISSDGISQQVKMLAMIEDAEYFYSQSDDNVVEITENTTWSNDKVKVIYGTLRVADGKQLEIEAGTQVYMHSDANIEVAENAGLYLNGTQEDIITIRSDRHDSRYDTLPRQWGKISIHSNGELLSNYAQIKGGVIGFDLAENSTATIENTQIYNMSSSGIFAVNATVSGKNVVISDAADACLNIEKGGNYTFYQSSFANVWRTGITGISGPNIPGYFSDYTQEGDTETYAALEVDFGNCIFWGSFANGIYLDRRGSLDFTYNFTNCLIKNEDTSNIDVNSDVNLSNTITEDPLFTSTLFSDQNLQLLDDSPAKNAGDLSIANQVPYDILGNNRESNPSIGAYQ